MENKLKYFDNEHILCSTCHKPVYMGRTTKRDSELCIGEENTEAMVYDNRTEEKKIVPISNFYVYE